MTNDGLSYWQADTSGNPLLETTVGDFFDTRADALATKEALVYSCYPEFGDTFNIRWTYMASPANGGGENQPGTCDKSPVSSLDTAHCTWTRSVRMLKGIPAISIKTTSSVESPLGKTTSALK